MLDFVTGVLLLGSLLHLTFGLWRTKMISPFGSSNTANILYGIFVLSISVSLYIYQYGIAGLLQNYVILGGLFAILYAVVFGI